MRFKKFFRIICCLGVLVPNLALADGMIVPPPDYYMFETDQKAVIFYENGIEDLILSITFRGNAKDFAWIIPTPSQPQVGKSSDELFTSLAELTKIDYYYDVPQPMALDSGYQGQLKSGVEVIETKQIDYYDVTVLAATESQALSVWLNDHGYKFPENADYILNDYIANQWYFTAVKVDSKYLSNNIDEQFRSGHAIPLRLTFASENIVYPLKISSVSVSYQEPQIEVAEPTAGTASEIAPVVSQKVRYPYPPDYVNVLIYVFANHKQELVNFETLYASWLPKDKIEKLAFTDKGKPWKELASEKYYLTKLQRQMRTSEMTSDLFIKPADNDDSVNAVESISRSKMILAVVLSIGGVITLVLIILLLWLTIKK